MISLAAKHNDPMKKLCLSERIGYGLGDFSCNLVYQPITAFLLLYYTNVVGVSAAVAGSVLAISKILDGISDIIMGRLIDRTKSKHGQARPWLLRLCIPLAVCAVLVFTVPEAFGGMARIAWMFVTYNMVNTVCYTGINVSYASMLCLMTVNSDERNILGDFRMVFATVCQLIVNTFMLKMIGVLNHGEIYNQKGWTLAFIITGLVSILLYFLCFIMTKERVPAPKENEDISSFKEGMKSLFTNKYWLLLTAACVFNYFMVSMFFGAAAYYAQYVMGDIDKYSYIADAMSIAQFVSLLTLTPFMMKKIGKYKTYEIGMAMIIIACVLTGVFRSSLAGVCVMNAFKGIGNACTSVAVFSLIAETIDYGQWKHGVKCVGMGNAALGFGQKFGSGMGSAVLGFVLSAGGFSAQKTVQSANAKMAISCTYIWIPAVMLTAAFVIMLFYRKLDEMYPQIEAELAERYKNEI